MATLAINEANDGNQAITMVAATGGGDACPSGVRAGGWDLPNFLLVNNRDVATKTVTVDGVAYIIPVTTGIGVIPIRRGALGILVPVTYSAVTSLFVAAVRLTKSD